MTSTARVDQGFTPNESTEDLRRSVGSLLARWASPEQTRQAMESPDGADLELWRQAHRLGLPGLGISESHGGGGADLLTVGVVFEELGRVSACAPFFSTMGLSAVALEQLGQPGAHLLREMASDGVTCALAWSGSRPAESTLRVDGAKISGRAPAVVDGAHADHLLVAAKASDGRVQLLQVANDAAGLDRRPLVSLDSTRRLAALTFDEVPGAVLSTDARTALDRTHDVAVLLLSAEQLGGAEDALSVAVEHARNRVQFGRRIGSFQAVKHRCADMLVDVEMARSVVYHGLSSAHVDPSSTSVAALLAGSIASETYLSVARGCLQLHGALGFTWEHTAHVHLKRAKSSSLMLGAPVHHRRRLAELLDLEAAA